MQISWVVVITTYTYTNCAYTIYTHTTCARGAHARSSR